MNIEGLFLRTVWKIKNTNILSTKSYCNNFLCIALFFVYSRFYGKCECSRCGRFSSRSVIYSQAWACLHGVCVQLETGKRLWRQETCKSSRLVPGVCCHDLCAVRAIFVTVDQNASNIVKSLIFYFHPSIFVIKKKKKQFLHPMFLLRSKSYMLKVPTSSKTQFILSLLTSMEQLTHLFLQLPFHLQLYFYLYLSGIN